MNWRRLSTSNQWIHVTNAEGPFHRQYRHRPSSYYSAHAAQRLSSQPPSTQPQEAPYQNRQQRRMNLLSGRHRRGAVDSDFPHGLRQTIYARRQAARKHGAHVSCTNEETRKSSEAGHGWARNTQGVQKSMHPKRLLWFRTSDAQRPKVATLLDRFDSAGMAVEIADILYRDNIENDRFNCSLIMLECVDIIEQDMLTSLEQIRAYSNAPLIVLTDNPTLDWSLLALREGADAIFTLNTPDEVILARSTALLRRWQVD